MTKEQLKSLNATLPKGGGTRQVSGLKADALRIIDETNPGEFVSLSNITQQLVVREETRNPGAERKHACVSAVYQARTMGWFTKQFTPYRVTQWDKDGSATNAEPIVGKAVNRDQLYCRDKAVEKLVTK